jgi:hypothetical protein
MPNGKELLIKPIDQVVTNRRCTLLDWDLEGWEAFISIVQDIASVLASRRHVDGPVLSVVRTEADFHGVIVLAMGEVANAIDHAHCGVPTMIPTHLQMHAAGLLLDHAWLIELARDEPGPYEFKAGQFATLEIVT